VLIQEYVSSSLSSEKQFVCEADERKEARDSAGGITAQYFASGEMISGSSYFYSLDQLGSTREMVTSTGTIVSDRQYDPYGRVSIISESVAPDFGFAGYYMHPRSGLNLTLARAYSASYGRFINRDPIEESGGVNLYAYVVNDPVGFTDDTGLIPSAGIYECPCKKFKLTQDVVDKMIRRHGPGPAPKYNTNDLTIFRKDFWNSFTNDDLLHVLCNEQNKRAAENGREAYVASGLHMTTTVMNKFPFLKNEPSPVGKVYPKYGKPYDTNELTVIVIPTGDPQTNPQPIVSIHPGPPQTGD
jgi:RHS repeat-associated protein